MLDSVRNVPRPNRIQDAENDWQVTTVQDDRKRHLTVGYFYGLQYRAHHHFLVQYMQFVGHRGAEVWKSLASRPKGFMVILSSSYTCLSQVCCKEVPFHLYIE